MYEPSVVLSIVEISDECSRESLLWIDQESALARRNEDYGIGRPELVRREKERRVVPLLNIGKKCLLLGENFLQEI